MELFQPGHLIPLLIVAAFLFFGWKHLPEMSRSVGRSLRVFKTEIKGLSDDDKAREAAKHETSEQAGPKALDAPAPAPVVVPAPQAPVAARAEVVRNGAAAKPAGSRPRPAPRPAGSTTSSGQ